MHIEPELQRVLRRESPSPGFAARVMTRIERDARPVRQPWRRAVAAAIAVVLLGGGWGVRHEVERRRGEHAKEQLLIALRITGSKMHAVRSALH